MNYKIYLLSLACMVFLTNCNKDYPNPDTNDCQDVVLAEGVYNDASNIMEEAAATGRLPLYADVQTQQDLSACTSIKYHNLNNTDPDTIIVDFGPSDCLCSDNRYRRGQILAIINHIISSTNNSYFDTTIVNGVNIQFNGYYVNDYLVQGSKSVTIKGRNSTTHNYEMSSAVSGKITNKSNQTMTWNSSETMVVLNEVYYTAWLDNVYNITGGTATGSGFNGTSYTAKITTPLVVKGSCWYITSGIMTVTPSGQTDRIVNFGNDACDRNIDVTLDGNHYNINQN